MMCCTLDELRCKEVIDVCNGCRLGFVEDVEIDIDCGQVLFLLVPTHGFRMPFCKSEPQRIAWKNIERIACDTIWVRVPIPPQPFKKPFGFKE